MTLPVMRATRPVWVATGLRAGGEAGGLQYCTDTPHTTGFSMRLTAALLLALASGSCMRATATAEGAALGAASLAPPKLIVFITVDQLRGDMLDRYRSDMQHGYARLMQGAWFTRGYHEHAITE